MTEIGERVGALLSVTAKEVKVIGYGVYAGMEVPANPPFGYTWEEFDRVAEDVYGPAAVAQMKARGVWPVRTKNPKIELDSGKVVWGMECWWASEAQVQARVDFGRARGAQIIDVDIDDERQLAIERAQEVTT